MSRAKFDPHAQDLDRTEPESEEATDGDLGDEVHSDGPNSTDDIASDDLVTEAEAADGMGLGGADDEDDDAEFEDAAAVDDMESELVALAAERDEYLDTLRRVQADFENYKKRVLRQQTEHLERAAEGLVAKLLSVLDTVDLALAHAGEDDGAVVQVAGALWDVLGKEGLEKLDPLGGVFDPNEAEAVMHEPAEDGQAVAEVIEVLRPGYRWRGRVIRPAMVKVKG